MTGSIGVIVVRGDLLFLAQCGPGHPFGLVPGKVDYLQDENLNMRGLGSSRTPTVYYSQMQFSAGDKFLFSTTLPDGWDANTFTAAYGASLHQAQKRFMSDAGENLVGLMLNAEPGSGQLHLLQAPGVPQPSVPPREAAKKPAACTRAYSPGRTGRRNICTASISTTQTYPTLHGAAPAGDPQARGEPFCGRTAGYLP